MENNNDKPILGHYVKVTPDISDTAAKETSPPEENETTGTIYKNILEGVLKLSISIAVNAFVYNACLIFLNDQTPAVQGAVSLGTSIMNIFGNVFFQSLNYGLMVRLSHVYGAKNYKLMGLYIHRGLFVNLFFVILCTLLVLFAPNIFRNFGYDPALLANMTSFVRIGMIQFFFQAIWNLYSNYLNAIANFETGASIQIFSSLCCIGLAYYFIEVLGLEIAGAAWAIVAQAAISAFLVVIYVYCKDPVKGTLFWFEKDSFVGVWELAWYILKAGAQIYLDWIGNEVIILLSGTLEVAQCDAIILGLYIYFIIYSPTVANGITSSSFVGNCMGAKQIEKAKAYAKASLVIQFCYTILIEILILSLVGVLVPLYTQDSITQGYMRTVVFMFMIMTPFDFTQYIVGNVCRAIKLEVQCAIITVVAIYFFAIPAAFVLVLAFDLQYIGIMIGLWTTPMLGAFAFTVLILRTNWVKQANIIAEGIDNDQKEIKKDSLLDRNTAEVKNISGDD